ncbi:Dyp-type peroxidase [Gayadomonas joobiniege]|uniref:Dyp-type peroxidase n=1 Tax=Gayadomonas joobiniege TaxID=1234606 RepID=UPI00035D2298|nr:Dyp-type peroxidase [Gayadomonas joobiniege]
MQFQQGLIAQANLHGMFLMMNAAEGAEGQLRRQLPQVVNTIALLREQYSEAELSGFVAVGLGYWDILYPGTRPDFVDLSTLGLADEAKAKLPDTPFDLFVQIKSDRYDINHMLIQSIRQILDKNVFVVEQIKGFRYLDGRNLLGFHSPYRNISGKSRQQLALVDHLNPDYVGGSYILMQRCRYHIAEWERLTLTQQERIYGLHKADGRALPEASYEASHSGVLNGTLYGGGSPFFVSHDMPFGGMHFQGEISVACAADCQVFANWLKNRFGAGEQVADPLLDYVKLDASALFFAPPSHFMAAWAERV